MKRLQPAMNVQKEALTLRGQNSLWLGPSVTLRRDEIESVVEIIKGACENVRIADGEYEFESLDELEKVRGTNPERLTIEGYGNVRVSLEMDKSAWQGLKLWANDTDEAKIAFVEIQRILQGRRRQWLYAITTSKALGIALALCFMAAVVLQLVMQKRQPSSNVDYVILAIPFMLFACVWWSVGYFQVHFGRLYSISLRRRHDTWWQRNGERVVGEIIRHSVNLLFTGLGFGLGVLYSSAAK